MLQKGIAATVAIAMLAGSVAISARPAAAAPFTGGGAKTERYAAELVPVQWRRAPPRGYRGRPGPGVRWYGPGAGAAILGGVIIGGALMATAIAENRASRRDIRACARDFPDFDPRSGTYIDRYGDVRICPYLR